MPRKLDPGLESWRRSVEAASEEVTEQKPIEEMTDDELEEAISASKRALLDAQHAELRALRQEPVEDERRYFSGLRRRPYWR